MLKKPRLVRVKISNLKKLQKPKITETKTYFFILHYFILHTGIDHAYINYVSY